MSEKPIPYSPFTELPKTTRPPSWLEQNFGLLAAMVAGIAVLASIFFHAESQPKK